MQGFSIAASALEAFLVISVSVAMLIYFTFLEMRFGSRIRRPLRILMLILAAGSLMLIGLRPLTHFHSTLEEAVVLTPGAERMDWRAGLDSLSPRPSLFALRSVDKMTPELPSSVIFPDLQTLLRTHANLRKVYLLGDGAELGNWSDDFPDLRLSLKPPPPQSGIISIDWPRQIRLGETAKIEGSLAAGYNSGTELPYKLRLVGPLGTSDSLLINRKANQPFVFNISSLDTGRFAWHLHLENRQGDRILSRVVPVAVSAEAGLKILIVEGSTRFDTKYFKQWCMARGYYLAIRSAISRERTRSEFINGKSRDISYLSRRLLAHFDLLIVDGRSLKAFTAAERNNLESAIEGGMGIYLSADDAYFRERGSTAWFRRIVDFPLVRLESLDYRAVRPQRFGASLKLLPEIKAEPYNLPDAPATLPLLTDQSGQTLVSLRQYGLGRVALSLVRDPYLWILRGEEEAYSAYWTEILSGLVRYRAEADQWRSTPRIPLPDDPVEFYLSTERPGDIAVVISPDGSKDTLVLAKDPYSENVTHGRFWPRKPGWQRIQRPGELPAWFYVHENGSWPELRSAERQRLTHLQVFRHETKSAAPASNGRGETASDRTLPPVVSAKPFPPIWFYLLFILSLTGLWIERKFAPAGAES